MKNPISVMKYIPMGSTRKIGSSSSSSISYLVNRWSSSTFTIYGRGISLTTTLKTTLPPTVTTSSSFSKVIRSWFSTTATTTTPSRIGLDAFRDAVPRDIRMRERVGRSWSVTELRRKSYDDCQKLWYV
jgi:Mitochondrial 39-S ribosomal protein L47 (MRP-L47)